MFPLVHHIFKHLSLNFTFPVFFDTEIDLLCNKFSCFVAEKSQENYHCLLMFCPIMKPSCVRIPLDE